MSNTQLPLDRLHVQNFKNIEDLDLEINGRSFFIVGDNGVGKTSFIQAMWILFSGQEVPAMPIMDGKDKAIIHGEFGGYKATMTFNKSGRNTLRLEHDGEPIKTAPRNTLNSIVGNIGFDPFEFLRLPGTKQTEFVKELTGLNFDDLDKERDETFELRAINNVEIKNVEGKVSDSLLSPAEMKAFSKEKDLEPVKVEISGIDTHNERVEKMAEIERKLLSRVAGFTEVVTKKETRITEIDKQVEELRKEKEGLYSEIENSLQPIIDQQKNRLNTWVADWNKNNPKKKSSVLNEKYQELIRFNEKVTKVKGLKADMLRLDELKLITADYKNGLDGIKEKKNQRIKEANMPVPGLSFNDDGLTLNGLSFDEESIPKSQIIKAGIDIMMSTNPSLKICRIKDGSLLGSAMDEVLAIVREQGYQIFVEIVAKGVEKLTCEIIED